MAEAIFLDNFGFEAHGDLVLIQPTSGLEDMQWELLEPGVELLIGQLKEQNPPMVVFNLKSALSFGEVYLSLLLRLQKGIRKAGGKMVLCEASRAAAESLRVTALDQTWAIYDTTEDALEALS